MSHSKFLLKNGYRDELHACLQDFKGFIMPQTFGRIKDRIKNMEVRDDDIWVTSFPKSGTTWCQEMIWLIANDFDYKGAKKDLNYRYPFLEHSSLLDFNNYADKHPEFECPDYLLDSVTYIDKLPSPRYIKTHLPWHMLPLQIQNGIKNPKIIHTIRNPKDVLVSFHNHACLLHGYKGSFKDFFDKFIKNELYYTPYFDTVFSFWNMKHLNNLLIIQYEDMQEDLNGVIQKVAKFMNKNVPKNEIPILLRHLSFEQMSKNPAVNFEEMIKFLKMLNVYEVPDKKFMRRGKCGSYKESLTREMIEIMDKWIEKNCKGSDLYFE